MGPIHFGLVLCVAACGGRSAGMESSVANPANEQIDSESEVVSAVVHYSLEFQAASKITPPITEITLVETNEMGANVLHDLGAFDGECRDATQSIRREDAKVLLAFHCQPFEDQRGALVHIIARRGRLVLLRAWLGATKPTFDEFDQIGEIPPYQAGASLVTEFD